MADHINDGGPAFPTPGLQADEAFNGMSLRDYFAGLVLQAAVRNAGDVGDIYGARVAEVAYYLADAMLQARETRRG